MDNQRPPPREFQIGQSACLTKTIQDADVRTFAEISEDRNPIHLDETFAASSRFGRRVVHGMLQASLISAVLGNQLPGPGSIYREQTLRFKKPAFIGDTLTATVEIVEMKEKIGLLILKTTVTNQNGELLTEGVAKGIIPLPG